jgi:hypothetical protein
MRYKVSLVNISHCFLGETGSLFFLINPRRERLFDYPTTGTIQPLRQIIHLVSKIDWHMRSQDFGF